MDDKDQKILEWEGRLKTLEDNARNAAEGMVEMSDYLAELRDAKRSVVALNVPEGNTGCEYEDFQHDLNVLHCILKTLQLGCSVPVVYRFGKVRNNGNPRPLKIGFPSAYWQAKALRRSHNLVNLNTYGGAPIYLVPQRLPQGRFGNQVINHSMASNNFQSSSAGWNPHGFSNYHGIPVHLNGPWLPVAVAPVPTNTACESMKPELPNEKDKKNEANPVSQQSETEMQNLINTPKTFESANLVGPKCPPGLAANQFPSATAEVSSVSNNFERAREASQSKQPKSPNIPLPQKCSMVPKEPVPSKTKDRVLEIVVEKQNKLSPPSTAKVPSQLAISTDHVKSSNVQHSSFQPYFSDFPTLEDQQKYPKKMGPLSPPAISFAKRPETKRQVAVSSHSKAKDMGKSQVYRPTPIVRVDDEGFQTPKHRNIAKDVQNPREQKQLAGMMDVAQKSANLPSKTVSPKNREERTVKPSTLVLPPSTSSKVSRESKEKKKTSVFENRLPTSSSQLDVAAKSDDALHCPKKEKVCPKSPKRAEVSRKIENHSKDLIKSLETKSVKVPPEFRELKDRDSTQKCSPRNEEPKKQSTAEKSQQSKIVSDINQSFNPDAKTRVTSSSQSEAESAASAISESLKVQTPTLDSSSKNTKEAALQQSTISIPTAKKGSFQTCESGEVQTSIFHLTTIPELPELIFPLVKSSEKLEEQALKKPLMRPQESVQTTPSDGSIAEPFTPTSLETPNAHESLFPVLETSSKNPEHAQSMKAMEQHLTSTPIAMDRSDQSSASTASTSSLVENSESQETTSQSLATALNAPKEEKTEKSFEEDKKVSITLCSSPSAPPASLPSSSSSPSTSSLTPHKKRKNKKTKKSVKEDDEEAILEKAFQEAETRREAERREKERKFEEHLAVLNVYRQKVRMLRRCYLQFGKDIPGLHPYQLEIMQFLSTCNTPILGVTNTGVRNLPPLPDTPETTKIRILERFFGSSDEDEVAIGDCFFFFYSRLNGPTMEMADQYLEMAKEMSQWNPPNLPTAVLTLDEARSNPVKLNDRDYESFIKHINDQSVLRCTFKSSQNKELIGAAGRMTDLERTVYARWERSHKMWELPAATTFFNVRRDIVKQDEKLSEATRELFQKYYEFLTSFMGPVILFDLMVFAQTFYAPSLEPLISNDETFLKLVFDF